MSPRFRFPAWLWAALVVSTAVSAWVGVERHREEASNRAVHLLADMPDIRVLAAVTGRTVPQVLGELKEQGLTGVAIAEETFDDLIADGRLRIESSPLVYVVEDEATAQRVLEFARRRLGSPVDPPAMLQMPDGSQVPFPARINDLRTFGLGFNEGDVAAIRGQGLSVVARLSNQPLGSKAAIDAMIDSASAAEAEGILFGGDQVLGRRELVVYAADKIRSAGFWIGPVEFTTQGGLARISRELHDRLLRVHSMVATEMERNEPPDIIDRYVRSVVERSMQALFLRPLSLSSEDPLDSFKNYVAGIHRGLVREGYHAKPATPDSPTSRPNWAIVACGLGIAAAAGFLATRLLNLRWGLAVTVVLAALSFAAIAGFGLKYLALAGALTFPTLAMLAAFDPQNERGTANKWIAAFLWITALSVAGGLHVAALLTEASFMLRLDQFFGVKLAHFLPPVFIAVYLLFAQGDAREILRGTVRWMDIVLMVLVMGAVFLMLSRTGNDAPGDVSAVELKVRNFLDRVLPERPRTKEFLIGHPALMTCCLMAFRGWRAWLPMAAFLAAVGQVSIVNTFCHLHTPIEVSAVRVLVGLILGWIVGAAVISVMAKAAKRRAA